MSYLSRLIVTQTLQLVLLTTNTLPLKVAGIEIASVVLVVESCDAIVHIDAANHRHVSAWTAHDLSSFRRIQRPVVFQDRWSFGCSWKSNMSY